MNEDQKFVYISRIIVGYINDGMRVDRAIDMVLGAGTYTRLLEEVYDEFNAKETK